MARVLTNNISLRSALESSIGTLPGSPSWRIHEPNTVSAFGAKLKAVERSPISSKRQRRKGTIVDLDSMVSYESDLTMSALYDHVEGFFFANAVNSEMVIASTDVANATSEYTVAALTSTQGGKLQWESGGYASLLWARGFSNADNNGLKVLAADAASTDTVIEVTDTLVDETPPANAELELCGVRAKTGDLAITVTSGVATLINGANSVTSALDFTTLGLTVGQFIHVGGLTTATQFSAGAGYGRITSIAADTIVLDKLSSTLATDPGTGDTVDLLFGQFVRNVANTHSDYVELMYQFELAYPDLGGAGTDYYEYALANFCDTMGFDIPLTDKAGVKFGFVGTDTETPSATRKTNASSALEPVQTSAFNTSADVARLRLADIDDTGLTTDFKSLKIDITNAVSPEKTIGTLGATYVNFGNFGVTITATCIFGNAALVTRLRENTTVSFDFMLKNGDGAFLFDIPSLTLGDGSRNFPVNETVTITLSGTAFEDDNLGVSASMSLFPVVP